MKPNSCACYGSNDIHECYCNLKNNNMEKETIEEAAKKRYIEGVYVINGIDICNASRECFIEGAEWQKERSYSEEDMLNFAWFLIKNIGQYSCDRTAHFEGKYLEQFKKK